MIRHSIDNTKPASRQKLLKHHGIPLVYFSKKEQNILKAVFDFYIFFPLHGNKKKYSEAQKLFDKINLSVSTLSSKKITIGKQDTFTQFTKTKFTK